MEKTLKLIGRIILGLLIAFFGVTHLMSSGMIVVLVPKFMPFPIFWVFFTGIYHIAFAVFIIGNLRFSMWIALGMAFLCLFYAFFIHGGLMFATTGTDSMNNMVHMLKDIGLAAGAIYIASDLKK